MGLGLGCRLLKWESWDLHQELAKAHRDLAETAIVNCD